ncbi:MAG TPA: CheR family methyltransferase [Terracidiphilus sp.]|jgi:two-component system CheB/CheR fusion protein|nr:CheR family methyltransferase [Terracidiphilus sp.]
MADDGLEDEISREETEIPGTEDQPADGGSLPVGAIREPQDGGDDLLGPSAMDEGPNGGNGHHAKAQPGGMALSIEGAEPEPQPPALPYPVVGFGASAGGLQAFREILETLDPETGMSFVLVTHLAPSQKSFLSEIIERYTQMPVVSIEDGQRPLPNHVYVLLPNQSLTIREGVLRVEPPSATERFPKTIDKFFHSLAADQKNHAIGVILSGADGDGALGLKAIKGEGGILLVQSPDSAVQSGMPRSSIASDHVDMVIPPGEIALELGRLALQFTRPDVRSLEQGTIAPDDEQSYQRILQMLRGMSGLDLRLYKPETIRRRIARRMLLLHMDHLSSYLRFLQAHGNEVQILQEDVLINVTRFFRDTSFWQSLRAMVLPALLQDRAEKPVRVWCAGCSTGEEAYSLAINILEYLSEFSLDTPVQIFGTDASEQSIEIARIAVYPETIATEVSPERLRRYFVKVDRGYQVSKRVRDCCIFARQNLCNDPPFSHIDVLSCRNVMIYFNQVLQRQVMLTFHYALEPGGFMLLGMSEGLRDYGEVFSTIDRKHKIYMKTGASLPYSLELPRSYAMSHGGGMGRLQRTQADGNVWPELELQRAADRIVLARFGPPGLIIDDRMNVLQARGGASKYMDIPQGAVSWSLMRVLNEGLVNETRTAARRAIYENVPAYATATIPGEDEEGEVQIRIEVLPITSAAARPRSFLVLFEAIPQLAKSSNAEQPLEPLVTQDEKDRLIGQLRHELASTRFHLQSLIEERDARNQELVSANEEIQSANEELQSTNEELETTKKELQSANEELQTVNDELQQRNNVLTQTGNDLTNLLNSVNIPLLMLTNDLHIRQFTPPMQKLLNVRATDIGRAISEIRLQLSLENIEPILSEVLDTLGTRELEVQDREGRWHLMRIRPYRTADNKIEGLVVVLLDIDQLRRIQQHLMDTRDFASSVVESVPVPIVLLGEDCAIRTVNTAFREMTQMAAIDLDGRSLPDLVNQLWGIDGLGEKLGGLLKSPIGSMIEFEHQSAIPTRKILLIKAQALSTEGARVLLLMIEDITVRRETELLIARQKRALEDEIEVTARNLNRTKEELRGLTAHLFTVQEEERQRVARELHDDISQRLSLLEIVLQEMRGDANSREDLDRLQAARTQVHSLNTDVRQISHRLHPAILSDLGLSAALQAMVKEFGKRENMPVNYVTQELPENWSPEAATAVYRIAQEALRNVAKHAGKTQVKVVLAGKDGTLQLRVMDFGVGFDLDVEAPAKGLGMISMQERARLAGGTLAVKSSLGQGTTVTADIPVENHG